MSKRRRTVDLNSSRPYSQSSATTTRASRRQNAASRLNLTASSLSSTSSAESAGDTVSLLSQKLVEFMPPSSPNDTHKSNLQEPSSSYWSSSIMSLWSPVVEYSNGLLKRLNSMRDDQSLCDYEIRVNGQTFHCHKFILIAMSDFFRLMLTGSMRESRESYVELKGFTNSEGIRQVLDYLYTGEFVNSSFTSLVDIIDAASHLQVTLLLAVCSDFLVKILNLTNCVDILKLSETYSLVKVVETCRSFICTNIVPICQDSYEQFRLLSLEQLKYFLSSQSLQVYSELDLFYIIVKWIDSPDCDDGVLKIDEINESRVKYAAELMRSVRFMCMSAEELTDHVEKVDFMRADPECFKLLIDAYKYHALTKRQPLITCEQNSLRNSETLVAVGEQNLYMLNQSKQKWEVLCSAPLEDNYPYPFSILSINNYLYVIGSRKTASSDDYRLCYRFSPRTLQWTSLTPLLQDRSRFGSVFLNDSIYVFGGFSGFKKANRVFLQTVERYYIEEDRWETVSDMETPLMSSVACCVHNGLVYFGGGKNQNWSKVSDFYCMDLSSKQTIKRASMLIARTTHQFSVVDDSIYVYGGFDDAGNGILSIDRYNIATDQWSSVTLAPGSMSRTWPQSIGFMRGRHRDSESSAFYVSVFHTSNTFRIMQKGYFYHLSTCKWTEAPVIGERARYCPTCTLTFPRNLFNSSSASSSTLKALTNNNEIS